MPPLMVVERAIASGTIIKGGTDDTPLSSPAATPSSVKYKLRWNWGRRRRRFGGELYRQCRYLRSL